MEKVTGEVTVTKEFSEKEMEQALAIHKEEAKAIIEDEDKFERLIERLEKKVETFPAFGKILGDLLCLVSLVRSFIKKEYRNIPIGIIIAIVATLIYIVSPIDLIPDVIPVLGVIDDMALFAWVLATIHSDVEEYRKWRAENGKQVFDNI